MDDDNSHTYPVQVAVNEQSLQFVLHLHTSAYTVLQPVVYAVSGVTIGRSNRLDDIIRTYVFETVRLTSLTHHISSQSMTCPPKTITGSSPTGI